MRMSLLGFVCEEVLLVRPANFGLQPGPKTDIFCYRQSPDQGDSDGPQDAPGGGAGCLDRACRACIRCLAAPNAKRQVSPAGRPIGLLIEPGGKWAFVSDEEGDQVLVIDLHRLEVVDRIPSGGKPDGLALVPARSE